MQGRLGLFTRKRRNRSLERSNGSYIFSRFPGMICFRQYTHARQEAWCFTLFLGFSIHFCCGVIFALSDDVLPALY